MAGRARYPSELSPESGRRRGTQMFRWYLSHAPKCPRKGGSVCAAQECSAHENSVRMRSEPLSLVGANWPGIAEKGSASLWRARASRLASRAGNALRALFRPSEAGPLTPALMYAVEEPTEDRSTGDAGRSGPGQV